MPYFIQDFDADFDAVLAGVGRGYGGPPYAFARWADGETAIAFGRRHVAKSDGWEWPAGKRTLLSDCLLDSLAYAESGWHVGVTAESHHPECHRDLLRYVNVPLERMTFAEIFIFANYRRFRDLDLSHCLTVGPRGDYHVPPAGVEQDWLWHGLADQLIAEASGPILVSAGPLANAIIYEYWRRSVLCPERRQVIIDVGSALQLQPRYRRIAGGEPVETATKITRNYQRRGSPLSDWKPAWKQASGCAEGPPAGCGKWHRYD